MGLRLAILNGMAYGEMNARQLELRLGFLSNFLDDQSVQDHLDDTGYHLMQDRIEVRDFVALRLADLLDIEVDPDKQQTADDWAKLRAQVREALQREATKSKKQPSPEATPKRGQ